MARNGATFCCDGLRRSTFRRISLRKNTAFVLLLLRSVGKEKIELRAGGSDVGGEGEETQIVSVLCVERNVASVCDVLQMYARLQSEQNPEPVTFWRPFVGLS